MLPQMMSIFFFSSRRRHTRLQGDWSSDVCSSDLRSRRRRPCRHSILHWRSGSRRPSAISASRTSSPNKISGGRSEEHTSELQSPCNLVCRLLLEKKKKKKHIKHDHLRTNTEKSAD